MGQSATLYEIKEDVFKKIAVDPSCFEINMTRHYEVFEKNFEGLLFLLSKSVPIESKDIVKQIFYPLDYLGESIDFGSIDIGNLDEDSIFDNEPISYLTPETINQLKELLNSLEKVDFIRNYNSRELNENGIYPEIWHDDESPDQAFNKRHIMEGFESLQNLFNRASEEGNYILVFVG